MEGRRLITAQQLEEIYAATPEPESRLNSRFVDFAKVHFFFSGDHSLDIFIRNVIKAAKKVGQEKSQLAGDYLVNDAPFIAKFSETELEEIALKKEGHENHIIKHLCTELECDEETAKKIILAIGQKPTLFIPQLISFASDNEIVAGTPAKREYKLYRDKVSGEIRLHCKVSDIPLSSVDDPERTIGCIPCEVNTEFKLDFTKDEGDGLAFVFAEEPQDPLLCRILTGEKVDKYEFFNSYSPFAEYMRHPERQAAFNNQIETLCLNQAKHIIGSPGLIGRILNGIKPDPRFNELMNTLLTLDPDDYDNWLDLASSIAMHALFDKEGHIRQDVYAALNQQGELDIIVNALKKDDEDNTVALDRIKPHLFSSYMEAMFGQGFELLGRSPKEGAAVTYGQKLTAHNEKVKEINAETIHRLDETLASTMNATDPLPEFLQRSIIKHFRLAVSDFPTPTLRLGTNNNEIKSRSNRKGKEKERPRRHRRNNDKASSSHSPFTDFLNECMEAPKGKSPEEAPLLHNLETYLRTQAYEGNLPGQISRCFNFLPCSSSIQPLIDTIEEAINNNDLDGWLHMAAHYALNDLFDEKGHIKPDVYAILNIKKEGEENGLLDLLQEKYSEDMVNLQLFNAYFLHIGEFVDNVVEQMLGEKGMGDADDIYGHNQPDPMTIPNFKLTVKRAQFLENIKTIDENLINDTKTQARMFLPRFDFYQARHELKKTIENRHYDERLGERGKHILEAVNNVTPYAPLHELTTSLRYTTRTIKNPDSERNIQNCRKQAKKVAGFPWGDVLGSLMLGLAGAAMILLGGTIAAASVVAIPFSAGTAAPFSIAGIAGGAILGKAGVGTMMGAGFMLFQACKQEAHVKPLRKNMLALAKEATQVEPDGEKEQHGKRRAYQG